MELRKHWRVEVAEALEKVNGERLPLNRWTLTRGTPWLWLGHTKRWLFMQKTLFRFSPDVCREPLDLKCIGHLSESKDVLYIAGGLWTHDCQRQAFLEELWHVGGNGVGCLPCTCSSPARVQLPFGPQISFPSSWAACLHLYSTLWGCLRFLLSVNPGAIKSYMLSLVTWEKTQTVNDC